MLRTMLVVLALSLTAVPVAAADPDPVAASFEVPIPVGPIPECVDIILRPPFIVLQNDC